MAGHLHPLPGGELGVNLAAQLHGVGFQLLQLVEIPLAGGIFQFVDFFLQFENRLLEIQSVAIFTHGFSS